MIWPQILMMVISMAISYATRPKPKGAKPAGLGDFNVPTAEDGRCIPILFGTRDLEGGNVVYYGDLKVTPIKKKA
ncbi:MAG: hypothetical protein ACI4NJ_00670 [Cellvibrio sp.]